MYFCDTTTNITSTVTLNHTTILSPNYPKNYPSGIDCRLIIQFPQGKQVQLEFRDFEVFQDDQDKDDDTRYTAASDETNDCGHSDWIEITDNIDSSKSQTVQRVCGRTIPRPIISTGTSLQLRFRSNSDSTPGAWKKFKMIVHIGKWIN